MTTTPPRSLRVSPSEAHQRIQDTFPTQSKCDFLLWTDGSGYQDLCGGSCAIVKDQSTGRLYPRVSASYGMNTQRAEFEALLMGLQCITDLMGWSSSQETEQEFLPADKKVTIRWFGDNESLVLSVYRDETGDPYYQRKSNPDLWRRMSYYESLYRIVPCHIKRNSLPHQALADRLASESRLMIKDFMAVIETEQVLQQIEKYEDKTGDSHP